MSTPSNNQQEQQQQPGLLGCCIACICCLICTPCIALCCCCAAGDTAVNKAQGKRWDAKNRMWVLDNLEEEGATLKGIPEDDDDILGLAKDVSTEYTTPATSGVVVKETDYYDALGVAPDADEAKIKRAYYIQARKWHPDRNDSAEAKEKFQKVGEAYQVLADPKLRAVYDKQGQAALSGDRTEISVEQLDPSLVFTFLFGSDAFNDIIGRLALVTQMAVGDPKETGITQSQLLEMERRRVVRLALKLRDRIQPFVDGNTKAAREQWKAEAERLVEVRYGQEILNTVGSTYRLVAKQCVGTWGEGMEARVDELKVQQDAAKAAVQNAQDMQQGDNDQLPQFIKMMWNVTVIDISSTLREVVMKVLSDKSVDQATREKRANAVLALGKIWEEQKSKSKPADQRSVRGLYQSAAQAAMEDTIDKMNKEEGKTEG